MYAQVTVTAPYDQAVLRQALRAQMGPTEVAPLFALMRTRFAEAAEVMAPTVVGAQAIRNAALILYFFDGPDTITIDITASAMVELKTQSRRVIRQLLPLLKRGKKVVKVNVLAEGELGIDSPILNGSRVSLLRQLISVAGEKWISKLLVPTIIFGLTSRLLVGTPAADSALYGFVAAFLAFLVEVALFIYHGDEWKWEEAR
jgi:hypothetical protein